MKKYLLIAAILSIFTLSAFAQNNPKDNSLPRDESKWSDITYVNVPVLKVLEGKDGYVVVYQKNRIGTASTVIPKAWAKGTPDNPRKLKFRNNNNPQTSYMTVVKKNNEFHRVILTIPMRKNNSLWGVVDYTKPLEGADKETLEELDL